MRRWGITMESRACFRLPVLQQRCKDTTFFWIDNRGSVFFESFQLQWLSAQASFILNNSYFCSLDVNDKNIDGWIEIQCYETCINKLKDGSDWYLWYIDKTPKVEYYYDGQLIDSAFDHVIDYPGFLCFNFHSEGFSIRSKYIGGFIKETRNISAKERELKKTLCKTLAVCVSLNQVMLLGIWIKGYT